MFFVCPSLQHFIGAFMFLTRSKTQVMVSSHTAGPRSAQQAERCVLGGDTSLLSWMLRKLLAVCVREAGRCSIVVLEYWKEGAFLFP